MVRVEGDDGSVAGHRRLHAPALHLHRNPSRRRRHHEAQAAGPAQHRRRPRPRAIDGFRCGYPVELRRGCAHRFLSEFAFDGSELVYSDPPYVRSTRRSRRRYRYDYADEDHAELLGLLKALPCAAMVSGYPSALYDERLAGWRSLEVQVANQACVAAEKLWFNFEPGRPHWHTGAGKNFTDRQRIKRLAASWARRYRAMPPGERLAVLAAVMAVEAE